MAMLTATHARRATNGALNTPHHDRVGPASGEAGPATPAWRTLQGKVTWASYRRVRPPYHPAQLYRLHTPANPTRRACGCRGTMLAIAWADARSHAPSPVFARRGGRAVVDNSDLNVHFKIKVETRVVCACAARAASRASCGPGTGAVACGSRASADRGGGRCMTGMQGKMEGLF